MGDTHPTAESTAAHRAHARPQQPLKASDPTRIHEYTLLGRIPGRHVSDVFIATAGGSDVVLKLAPQPADDDVAATERFHRELRNAKRVRSNRVARILDSGTWEGRGYMVQELIDGPTLAQMLDERSGAPLAEDDAARLATGLAEALEKLHEADVVHRDLTRTNVIVHPERGPVVLDFGISRASDDPSVTQHGDAVGTPGHMSPEQVAGQRPTHASDVFQWGIVVGWAMLGRHPVTGVFEDAVHLTATWKEALLDPRPDPALEGRLGRLVEQALEERPEQRPAPTALANDIVRTSLIAAAGHATATVRLPPPHLADARTPREAWRASAGARAEVAAHIADRWWAFMLVLLIAVLVGWLVGGAVAVVVAAVAT